MIMSYKAQVRRRSKQTWGYKHQSSRSTLHADTTTFPCACMAFLNSSSERKSWGLLFPA